MSNKRRFKINPCKSAEYYSKITGYNDIQNINDICYSVCAAYGGSTDIWNINGECADICKKCVNNCKGADTCDHPAPLRPPIFIQAGHYFPRSLMECGDPAKALSSCVTKCNQEGGLNIKQCVQNCYVDAAALTNGEKKEEYETCGTGETNIDIDGGNIVLFYLGILIVGIFFVLLITLFVRNIFFKK